VAVPQQTCWPETHFDDGLVLATVDPSLEATKDPSSLTFPQIGFGHSPPHSG
jgi:hypothetical protein